MENTGIMQLSSNVPHYLIRKNQQKKPGYKGIEVAEALSLSPSSVSRIVESGENILDNKKDVAVKIADMEI